MNPTLAFYIAKQIISAIYLRPKKWKYPTSETCKWALKHTFLIIPQDVASLVARLNNPLYNTINHVI